MLQNIVADDYVHLWATAVAALHSKHPNPGSTETITHNLIPCRSVVAKYA